MDLWAPSIDDSNIYRVANRRCIRGPWTLDLGTPDESKEGRWTSCIPESEITVSGSLIYGTPATKHRKMVVRGCLVSSRFRLLFS